MSSEVKIYEKAEFGKVRTIRDEDGCVWYCGKDVCDYLEYKNITKVMRDHVKEEDRTKRTTVLTKSSEAGKTVATGMVYVNKAGLFSLVIHSTMPKAQEFYDRLTHEVLPQIEETGMYVTPAAMDRLVEDPRFLLSVVTNWHNDRCARLAAEEQVRELEQENKLLVVRHAEEIDAIAKAFDEEKVEMKAQYEESEQAVLGYVSSKGSILVRDFVTILWQNGVKIGQKKLFELFVKEGYLVYKYMEDGGESKHYMPTQKSKDMDLFHVTVRTVDTGARTIRSYTSKITAKGQMYFLKHFMREFGVMVNKEEKEAIPEVINVRQGGMEQSLGI